MAPDITNIHQADLPFLGIGLGLKRALFPAVKEHRSEIDWLEIITENYMGKGGPRRRILDEALELGFPVIPHGVMLSIGGTDPFSEDYLNDLDVLLQRLNPPWFSDHLCFTGYGGQQTYELMPLPRTWETVEHVVSRIRFIQQCFQRPFLIENASAYADMAVAELTEAQFLAEIAERSGCGLLLDVNNIYVNAINFRQDPIEFLEGIPLERVVQLHMAGHLRSGDFIIDTHGEAICEEVYALLGEVLARTSPRGILLERDSNIPAFEQLRSEINRIRMIAEKAMVCP